MEVQPMRSTPKPHMPAEQFAWWMKDLQLSVDDIVTLTSSPRQRIEAWIDGSERVPFHWYWVFPILASWPNKPNALRYAHRAMREGDGADPREWAKVHSD